MIAKGRHQLTVTLPSDKEIAMERVFDAPRHLVFETFTKAEHLRRPEQLAPQGVAVTFQTSTPGVAYNSSRVRPSKSLSVSASDPGISSYTRRLSSECNAVLPDSAGGDAVRARSANRRRRGCFLGPRPRDRYPSRGGRPDLRPPPQR